MTVFRPMTALANRQHRLPEQGRIRAGVKTSRFPKALQTLRFTSRDQTSIEAIAKLYGGEAHEWADRPGEYEVVTQAAEVPIVLPPDPLGEPFYELWSKGGLARRCDGEEVVCPKRIDDSEVAMEKEPCICNARKLAECKVTLRLNVILPDLPFGGTWRLDTHSWNALDELPGMVEAVQAFTDRAFVRAYLGLRPEEKMNAGQKQKYVKPYLRVDESVSDVLAGGAGLSAIPAGPQPLAIEAPEMVPVVEAKQTLLLACNGDRAEALRLWGERGSNPIARAELEQLVADTLPPCEQDQIVEAEVVDEWGAPF